MRTVTKIWTALVLVAVLLVSACGTEVDSWIDIALGGDPGTLDPHSTTATLTFQVTKPIYETLFAPNQDGTLAPALATSVQLSLDGRELAYTLKEGVKFHDGSDFDSEDVKASIERILDPDYASPSAAEFAVIDWIETPDPLHVVFHLSAPSAPLQNSLASGWAAILPSEKIASGHNFAAEPVGTGPFTLSSYTAEGALELVPFADYHRPNVPHPSVEGVRMVVIPDPSVQVQGLETGELDVLYIVDEQAATQMATNESIRLQEELSSLIMVLTMNTSRQPFDSLQFRQAVNHAINKQEVLDIAYGGGEVGGTFNDTANPFHVDFSDLYPYDPSTARSLIEASGYDGRTLKIAAPSLFDPHVKAAQIYQQMLAEVGIASEVELVEWNTWIEEIYSNANYDMTVIGHTGKLDPHGRFVGYGKGSMYIRWPNERVAELIDQGVAGRSFEERFETYRELQELFAVNVPFVFTGSSYRTIATRVELEGFYLTPNLETFEFAEARFADN